jgi:hypothetical protein
LTYVEAAIEVLSRSREPLTLRELVGLCLQQGLIAPAGRTPDKTMAAALYAHVAGPHPLITKLERRGPNRAERGSVHWTLRQPTKAVPR